MHPTHSDHRKPKARQMGLIALGVTAVALPVALLGFAQGQQVHRNGFEARTPAWGRGPADAAFKEAVHEVTDQTAHTGQLSEHIQLTAEQGSQINYHYPTAKAPLADELTIRVWVKSNRPGTQLAARLVLPRERNPQNLNEPLTALLRGDQYQLAGRWQPLELRRPVKIANEQKQLMRAELKRDVDFTDAYIDRLVLNVYGGPGLTDIWLDDLEIGPVVDGGEAAAPAAQPAAPTAQPAARHAVVELNDHLSVNGKRFFFRGIRRTDTPLRVLRDAGFNTVWLDTGTLPERIDEAINLGFWLVPALPPADDMQTPEHVNRAMSYFRQNDAVLFWDLGGGKTHEEAAQVAKQVQIIHAIDGQRPKGADVWDGFTPYSRHLGLVGTHRWPLMTGMEMTQYRDWLTQRRLLARPGTFMWTWVQTHLPDWYNALVYNRPASSDSPFADPIGPQPEQIRLLTYIALSAGAQGLGYWSDRYLADSHQGRDRLLTLALLNQEMQMLEPLLLTMIEPPSMIDTSHPEVKAAVIRSDRGVLVIPMWLGKGAQFVPGQSATVQLSMVVPQVPGGTQAWEVSPGDVRSLQNQRVPGGTRVVIPEFGLTTAVVFTSDNSPTGLLVRFQEQARKTRKQASEWMLDLAEVEMEKVLKVEEELEKNGHALPDGAALKDDARARLEASKTARGIGDHRQAYFEAQRALRPLRILMRAQWEAAVRQLDVPQSSIYALSFFTLPKHYDFMRQLQRLRAGVNVLPDGDFESTPDKTPVAWLPQEISLDDVEMAATRVNDEPREGRRCLKLEVKPKNTQVPPGALERTYLAINSPAVKLQPGSMVRVSGWVKVPKAIAASADGALLFDSAGGEPLAVRLSGVTPWKKFTLYRQVPESGSIHLTVALTGIGTAYFDDLRIEPLAGAFLTSPPAPPAGRGRASATRARGPGAASACWRLSARRIPSASCRRSGQSSRRRCRAIPA